MHGFGGYFDSTLYADEMISILPSTHSPGMISWFPVFIPIKVMFMVHKDSSVNVRIGNEMFLIFATDTGTCLQRRYN